MDAGGELRHAREQRGLSLEEVSRRTKIRIQFLRAIENNDIEHLPAAIFTRGFVKAFAAEVGLDPVAAWQRYAPQLEPPPPEQDDAVEAPPVVEVQDPPRVLKWAAEKMERVPSGATVLALVVLVSLAYLASGLLRAPDTSQPLDRQRARDVVASAGRAAQSKSAPAHEVAPTTGSAEAVPSATATTRAALRIELQPPQLCWVSATADGRRVVYRLMQPGERQTVEAREQLVLQVGDGARFAYSINGSPGRPLAPAGQPGTVRITPQNYTAFVAR